MKLKYIPWSPIKSAWNSHCIPISSFHPIKLAISTQESPLNHHEILNVHEMSLKAPPKSHGNRPFWCPGDLQNELENAKIQLGGDAYEAVPDVAEEVLKPLLGGILSISFIWCHGDLAMISMVILMWFNMISWEFIVDIASLMGCNGDVMGGLWTFHMILMGI